MSIQKTKHYIIYETTNIVNNKKYIGCHRTYNINDNYLGSGIDLIKDIEKYGQSSFVKTILFIFDNKKDMFDKERELITNDIVKNKNYYNKKVGGDGGYSPCSRIKAIKKLKYLYQNNIDGIREKIIENGKKGYEKVKELYPEGTFKGKQHTEETKEKIRKTLKIKQKGELNSQYGKKWIYNDKLNENKSVKKEDVKFWVNNGWKIGRVFDFDKLKEKEDKLKEKEDKLKEKEDKLKEKEDKLKENKLKYNKWYKIYDEYGFDYFVKTTNYDKTKQNLVMLFKRYVDDFKPQNGKKRGS